jgi:hypothetical protein
MKSYNAPTSAPQYRGDQGVATLQRKAGTGDHRSPGVAGSSVVLLFSHSKMVFYGTSAWNHVHVLVAVARRNINLGSVRGFSRRALEVCWHGRHGV